MDSQHATVHVWLISLSVMVWGFIYFVAHISTSFLFMAGQYSVTWIYHHCLTIHLLMDTGCFHLWLLCSVLLWTWLYLYLFERRLRSPSHPHQQCIRAPIFHILPNMLFSFFF